MQIEIQKTNTSKEQINQGNEVYSITGSLFWCFILTILLSTIIGFIVLTGMRINGDLGVDLDLDLVFNQPNIMFYTSMISAIITIPLLKVASKRPSYTELLEFIKIKSINNNTLIKLVAFGVIYYGIESLTISLLGIGTPQYMLDVKSQIITYWDLLLLILAVCIIVPIIEEVIFRGVIFTRLQLSRVGTKGAVIYTSIIFGILHFQYEIVFMVYTLLVGILLAVVRIKTNNLMYCIVLHMIFNSLSTLELLF